MKLQLPNGLIVEREDNKTPAVQKKATAEKKPQAAKRGRPPKAKQAESSTVEGCPLPSTGSKSS